MYFSAVYALIGAYISTKRKIDNDYYKESLCLEIITESNFKSLIKFKYIYKLNEEKC
jgi:hypothetical protein